MKFAHKALVLIGCLVFDFLLSYAQGVMWQDAQIESKTVLLNPNQRTGQIGKSATVILLR